MKCFITGGAGYIGSHTVKLLREKSCEVLVYDNFSTGSKILINDVNFVDADIDNVDILSDTLKNFNPDVVVHFAASIDVNESIKNPMKYYNNNLCNTLNLVKAMMDNGLSNLIYSSTAAVYGQPEVSEPVSENHELNPINPYGKSKMASEMFLQDIDGKEGFKSIILRFFNAAGAAPDGEIGQINDKGAHLITNVLKAAREESSSLSIFGTDYPTEDGTCVRDYVHVSDIASAHIKSIEYLKDKGVSDCFNLGYGQGYSVKDVISAASKVVGKEINAVEQGRREGDPAYMVADSSKAREILGWSPAYNDLEYIIRTAWDWDKKMAVNLK